MSSRDPDGIDNASVATVHDVVAAAKAHDVLLMMLAFSVYDEPALQQMVSGSGGYFIGAEDASTLAGTIGEGVLQVLEHG